MALIGNIDGVSNNVLHGWAYDDSSDEPLTLNIFANNDYVGTLVANIFRSDIAARIGNSKCSYQLELPAQFATQTMLDIQAINLRDDIPINVSRKLLVKSENDKYVDCPFRKRIDNLVAKPKRVLNFSEASKHMTIRGNFDDSNQIILLGDVDISGLAIYQGDTRPMIHGARIYIGANVQNIQLMIANNNAVFFP